MHLPFQGCEFLGQVFLFYQKEENIDRGESMRAPSGGRHEG